MVIDTRFLLQVCFNPHKTKEGSTIWWRDCILQKDMNQGEQGYLWVFENGETFHSYRTPEQCDL